jgi:SAM-dependent methyltransferase
MPPVSYYEDAVGEYERYHTGDRTPLRWWHRAFLRNFPGLSSPGRLLDVGCADGRFLREMKARGWSVCGVDFDSRSVGVARRMCPSSEIHHGSMDDAVQHFGAGSFDLVTFFEVLEHQTDPVAFVGRVRALLRKDGAIGGSVPNRDRYVMPTRYSPDLPPHHFTLWTAHVLRCFLEREGFAAVQTFLARYEPTLFDQATRHVMRAPLARMKLRLGVRSFESADYAPEANMTAFALTAAKRFLWNPAITVATLVEYPLLWLSRKAVSLGFHGRLDGVERAPGLTNRAITAAARR